MLDLNKAKGDTTVVVAMSGGVDSSVVAAMLSRSGYKVIGITLQLYDHGMTIGKKGACCAGKDIYDAQMVASSIGIPHYVLDYESKFTKEVIDDFADSYLRGETPLPCVRCNQSVKFVDLVKIAKDLGADCLATGHYVQRKTGTNGPELHTGIDPQKDQSYFLFATSKQQLEFLRFPLGGMRKDETRKIAEELGLVVADKPDSQDICFVPEGNYAKLVEKLRPGSNKEGKIVHIDGFELGTHSGIINYTIGQRRKIGIAHNDPLYVVRIDPEANIVYVGPQSALGSREFVIKEVNWLGKNDKPIGNFEVKVKTRSRQDFVPATIVPMENNMMRVILHSEQKSITPGQACVIYDDTQILGGGWITRLP